MTPRVDGAGAVAGAEIAPANRRLGMILFIAADAMLFGALMAGFVVLRFGSGGFAGMERISAGPAALGVCLMAGGSLALLAAGRWLARGKRSLFKGGVLGALLLGVLVLALQILQGGWGLAPRSSIYGGMIHLLTWAHAAHVGVGIAILAVLALRTFGTDDMEGSVDRLAVAAFYWHFVTLVRLGVFAFLALS